MKKIILTFCGFIASIVVTAQQNFTIEGTLASAPDKKMIVNLYYNAADGRFIKDTSAIINGHFSFKGEIAKPRQAFFAFTENSSELANSFTKSIQENTRSNWLKQIGFIIEPGNIKARLDPEHEILPNIIGTPNNEAYQEFRPVIDNYAKLIFELEEKNTAAGKDAAKTAGILKQYEQMELDRIRDLGSLIKKYPNALISLNYLTRWVNPAQDLKAASDYFNVLSPGLKESFQGRRFSEQIKKAKQSEIGEIAPDFSMKDTEGKLNKLSDYRGKYVLLDFWASWCIPCRKDIPNLIKTYDQFKGDKFEIVAVSLDGGNPDSEQLWLNAIKQDKSNAWVQLSDLSGFDSMVAEAYSVKAIPMNFLLDPSGKIIAKNLHGKDLDNALKAVL